MMPKQHAAISLGVGLLGWWWSGRPAALPASLAAGTLIDLDHGADYAWYAATGEHRLLLPLHGYELALPLGWIGARWMGPKAAGAMVLAYLLHLVIDEQSNRTKPGTYFLMWRAINQFRLEALSRDPAAGIRGRNDDLVALRCIVDRLAAMGRRSTGRQAGTDGSMILRTDRADIARSGSRRN